MIRRNVCFATGKRHYRTLYRVQRMLLDWHSASTNAEPRPTVSAGRALLEPASGSHPRTDSLVLLQRLRRHGAPAFVALLLGACRSAPPAPAPETQTAAQPR